MNTLRTSYTVALLLAFTLAAGLRLFLTGYSRCISTDGVYYAGIARQFVTEGSPYHPTFPPLYPVLIGWLYPLTGNFEAAGRTVSALLGALAVWPAALLAQRIYGVRIACYTAFLVALHPVLVDHGTQVLTEAPFAALMTAALAAAYIALTHGGALSFGTAGIFLGLATLMRPEAIAYVPFVALIALSRVRRQEATRRQTIAHVAIHVLAFGLICFPYAHYLKTTTGSWSLTGKTEIMLTKAQAVGEPDIGLAVERLQQSQQRPEGFLSELVRRPLSVVKRCAMNVHLAHKYVVPELFPPLLLIITAMGLLRTVSSDRRQIFLLASMVPYTPVFLFIVEPRVFLPLVPIALIWSARGIGELQHRLQKYLGDKIPILGQTHSFHPVLLIVILSLLPYTLRPVYRPDPNAIYREAGLWMRDHVGHPQRIAFQKPWIAFYADAEHISIPNLGYKDTIRKLIDSRTTHLVVDSQITPRYHPHLLPLICGQDTSRSLTAIKLLIGCQRHILMIYGFTAVP